MLEDGRATKTETLAAQLNRRRCTLKLAKPGKRRYSAEELTEKCRASVVVVAQPYLCDHCDRTHCQVASGFMLTDDGAFCTSYHVITNRAAKTMIILTGDGRIAPVREVLAANRDTDLAILRAEGSAFMPLPLSTDAPAGSVVRVISHPNNRFYSVTEGIVSRHFEHTHRRNSISMLAITADFAKGSSGAPVFNEMGAVVASVNSTFSSYYDSDDEGHKEDLQMVFKNCTSSQHILELIEAK
jgi:S1-C subfamily serine protease